MFCPELGLIWLVMLFLWFIIPFFITLWLMDIIFRTQLLGNSVKVSKEQYLEINNLVKKNCHIFGMKKHPDVFVINSEGVINAVARKWLRRKYIILYSELIDTMSGHDSHAELDFIIGHELGHHAASHTAIWREWLLKPALLIPFLFCLLPLM